MNVNEQLDLLALRIEDADNVTFTDPLKLRTLNNAEKKIVQHLNPAYLTELQITEESVTATSGIIEISSLLNNVLRGAEGIVAVKIHGGLVSTLFDIKDAKKFENAFLTGSKQNPVHMVFQNQIVISAGVNSPVVDVSYLKMPTDLRYQFNCDASSTPADTTFIAAAAQGLDGADDYYNKAVIYSLEHLSYHVITDFAASLLEFTVEPAAAGNFTDNQEFIFLTHDFDMLKLDGVTSDLNPSLHELVVTLAESECWGMDRKLDRRKSALEVAMLEIEKLNSIYKKAEGLGTKGRTSE